MKFFNWMQNRFNGGQAASKKGYPVPPPTNQGKQETRNEEFSDWPGSLLAIGTLGNNGPTRNAEKTEENEIVQEEEEQCSSPDLAEFSPEEVGKLQKALTKLLSRKSASKAEAQSNNADLPLDRFLNCPSSLDVDRRLSITSTANSSTYDHDEDEIERTIRAIIGKCQDVCEKNKKKSIGKKSVSFLVKKMFACRGGFDPSPSLRDTFQESRMEKLLRTMLSKKMYPRNSSRAASMKRYIEDKRTSVGEEEENKREKTCDSGRWDKTDSEFIVLEI